MKLGKWLLATGIILFVTVALICIPPLVAYARTGSTANSARITITPVQQKLASTYTLTGVTGTPDPSQGQVRVRVLTYTTRPQFPQVKAQASSSSVAHGTLTLQGTSQAETLPAGTIFTASNGMKVKTASTVTVPAGQTATVAAATVTPGARGNLGPYGLDTSYTWSYQTPVYIPVNNVFVLLFCVFTIFLCFLPDGYTTSYDTAQVYNATAFTGGKNPAVSQDDLNQATAPIVTALTTQAQQGIQQQMYPGEQVVDTIACTPYISPARAPANTLSLRARVAVKCSAIAYQPQQVQTLAQNMLAGDAHTQLGAQYLLTGDYTTSIQNMTESGQSGATATFQVSTQGTWVWTLTSSLAQQFAKLVAGKTQAAALMLLRQQPGVSHVSIQTYGGGGTTLPDSPQAITIVAA